LEIKPTANYREPIYAHNTYLDIAVETGLPNSLVWMSLLFSAGLVFLKRREAFSMCLAVSVVIFSIHLLVETAIYSPVVLSLLLIVLSFSNLKEESDEKVA
jgi:O-antigen ligase